MPASTRSGVTSAVSDPGELQRRWKQVVDGLIRRDPPRGSLLLSAVALGDDGTDLQVGLPKGSTFAVKMLEKDDVRSVVETAIEEVFGTRTVRYVEASDVPTPASAPAAHTASTPAPDVPLEPAPDPAPASGTHLDPMPAEGSAAPWEPEPTSQPPSVTVPPAQPEAAPPSAPRPTPEPEPEPDPDPTPEPEATSAPETAPAASGQASEFGDILDMLTDVFGDGVTVKPDHDVHE